MSCSICSICLEELYQKENKYNVVTTSCNHSFHKKCLHNWFRNKKKQHNGYGFCPNCRNYCYEDSEFNTNPSFMSLFVTNIIRMVQPK